MGLFNRINLETPESVELEFTLAGIGNRAYALAIDYIILGLIILFSIIIFIFITFQVEASNLFRNNSRFIIQWLWAIELLIAFTMYVGYFVFFETVWQGQTPGKKRANIRVIADNGRTVNLAKSVLRALLRPIDDLLSIGVFLIIFGKKEKRIGDFIAGTLVIQEEKSPKNYEINISEEANLLAIQLAKEANLNMLSPENFNIIRNYLQRRNLMSSQAKREVARKLALQVQTIIELSEIPKDTTSNVFLESIYSVYTNSK